MGAWIEISPVIQSLRMYLLVAPLMGAWIEITEFFKELVSKLVSRAPHGRVD